MLRGMPPPRPAAALLALGCAALLAGCATRGAAFDADKIPRIEEGVTTRAEVEEWFGMPVSIQQRSSGFAIYRYLHEETRSRDSGVLSRIGRFIGRFFGRRGVASPVNVRYENTVRTELVLLFDPDGVVSHFNYERTEIPSREIY